MMSYIEFNEIHKNLVMINQNCLVILFYNQWLSQINVDLLQPWVKNHTLKLIQWLVRTSTLPLRKNYIAYTKHFNKLFQFSMAWVQNRYEPEEAMFHLARAAGYTDISLNDLKPTKNHRCPVGISSTPLKIYYEKEELSHSGGLSFKYCPICGRNLE